MLAFEEAHVSNTYMIWFCMWVSSLVVYINLVVFLVYLMYKTFKEVNKVVIQYSRIIAWVKYYKIKNKFVFVFFTKDTFSEEVKIIIEYQWLKFSKLIQNKYTWIYITLKKCINKNKRRKYWLVGVFLV